MAKIAFIGLGNMGGPMSVNLVRAGHDVTGYDIVPEKVDRAAAGGVKAAASNPDAVKDAEFVFAMLPTGREVRHVLVDGDGIFDLVGPETIVVDSSTTDLGATEYVHQHAASRGISMIDSPVSGGMAGAEAATLTFMAGGDGAAIDRVEPVFLAMGKKGRSRRRTVRRTGREGVQQHAAGHFDGGRLRSHRAGRSRRR